MSYAFFFPGQGSQSLKMMAGFADMPIIQQTFKEASAVLDYDLWALMNGEDVDAINATVVTQPLMLTAGVATYRAYSELGGKAPQALAGHSLGEYTALVVADSLAFADALNLVRLRAQFMQEAVPEGVGAMAAILGLEDDVVKAVCEEAALADVVEAVNFNSPGQVVIAGNKNAVERAMELAKEKGAKRALALPVSVPSHCSLMKPAAEKLADVLTEVALQQPNIPVLHNADVCSYQDANQIKDALVRQLYSPVRWTETVNHLVAQGIVLSAECGPGKVLTGLAKRINKEMVCHALTKKEDIQAFITL